MNVLGFLVSKPGAEVRAPLQSISSSYTVEVVALAYLSLGQLNDIYPYILVMTDLFSKYSVAVPTKDQTALTTAMVHGLSHGKPSFTLLVAQRGSLLRWSEGKDEGCFRVRIAATAL